MQNPLHLFLDDWKDSALHAITGFFWLGEVFGGSFITCYNPSQFSCAENEIFTLEITSSLPITELPNVEPVRKMKSL